MSSWPPRRAARHRRPGRRRPEPPPLPVAGRPAWISRIAVTAVDIQPTADPIREHVLDGSRLDFPRRDWRGILPLGGPEGELVRRNRRHGPVAVALALCAVLSGCAARIASDLPAQLTAAANLQCCKAQTTDEFAAGLTPDIEGTRHAPESAGHGPGNKTTCKRGRSWARALRAWHSMTARRSSWWGRGRWPTKGAARPRPVPIYRSFSRSVVAPMTTRISSRRIPSSPAGFTRNSGSPRSRWLRRIATIVTPYRERTSSSRIDRPTK